MNGGQIAELVGRMRSADLSEQLAALAEAASITRELSVEAVSILYGTSNVFPVAEQIAMFGGVIPPLEQLLSNTENRAEVRIEAASLLLHFGSMVGVDYLLTTIKESTATRARVALALGKAKVPEGRGVIIELLREWDFRRDMMSGVSLLTALHDYYDEPIPPDIRQRAKQELTGLVPRWLFLPPLDASPDEPA